MQLYEKKLQRIFYVLYDDSGNPKIGLIASDVVFRYAKANQSEYTLKTLTGGEDGNFGELGYGFYWTDMSIDETDVIGQLAIVITTLVTSPSPPSPIPQEIESKHLIYGIVPYPITPGADVPTCIVHGSVRELGGQPTGKPMAVYAQLLKLPGIVGDNFLSSKAETAYTDIEGVFKLRLAIGAVVRVEIPDAGIRRQFEVPDSTTAMLKNLPST